MVANRFASLQDLCMRSCSSWSNRHACTHLSSGKSASLLAKPGPFPAISPYLRAIVAALCVCVFTVCCLKIKHTHMPSILCFIVSEVRCPHHFPHSVSCLDIPSCLVTCPLSSKWLCTFCCQWNKYYLIECLIATRSLEESGMHKLLFKDQHRCLVVLRNCVLFMTCRVSGSVC